mgnify:CR=1 FL=1
MRTVIRRMGPIALGFCLLLAGCRSLYYAAYEKVGVEKRHLLRRNVAKVQKEQTQAAEEFKDVLTRIKDLTGFDGGQLESVYKKLDGDYQDCASRAEGIRERIGTVNRIGADLFKEWQTEIGQISNATLRSQSESALRDAQRRFATLQTAMAQSESRLEPVLTKVHDYVLYLKHNLNAQAVGALQGEVSGIEHDVTRLVEDMNRCIQEAQTFLNDFK